MSTLSANMNLPISTVGVDSGLSWEENLNAALTLIDQHTHAAGSGVALNSSSFTINSDFPLNNNDLTLTRSVRFQQQTPALPAVSPDLGCVYMSGGNLYYNNLSGDQVPITNGASLAGAAGTISGLPSGTASAAYAAGTFVFQSATNTAALIDGRNFILRNAAVSSKGLTLTPPSAMAADFSLILPALPGATSFLTLDTSGNIVASPALLGALTTSNLSSSAAILGSQLSASAGIVATQLSASAGILNAQITAGTITQSRLAANSVGTSQIIDANVTPGKLSARITASASTVSASGITSSQSLACGMSGTGRPVLIMLSVYASQGTDPVYGFQTARTVKVYKNGSPYITIYTTPDNSTVVTVPGFSIVDPTGAVGALTYDLRTDGGTCGPYNGATLCLTTVEL